MEQYSPLGRDSVGEIAAPLKIAMSESTDHSQSEAEADVSK